MHIGRIEGATRVLGKSQGYLGLPIRDEVVNCTVGGEGTPAMVTAWLPTEVPLAGPLAVHLCAVATKEGQKPETIIAEAVRAYLGDAA